MWPLLISLAIMGGEYVYHRWIDPPPPPPKADTIQIPLTETGSPIPLLYGRCRAASPILAYTSRVINSESLGATYGNAFVYSIDLFFVIGVPFKNGICHIYNFWVGDVRYQQDPEYLTGKVLGDLVGNGNYEDNGGSGITLRTPALNIGSDYPGRYSLGTLEFLNGNTSQQLVNPNTSTPTTRAGLYMTSTTWLDQRAVGAFSPTTAEPWNYGVGYTPGGQVPGYRGYLCAFHWSTTQIPMERTHWTVGVTPQVPAYSYEIGSYPAASAFGLINNVDCNPIDVINDLLTDSRKLGVDPSLIDSNSFTVAGVILANESHGYSRCFTEAINLAEMLAEVLRQIDGALYWDPRVGQMKIKLVRGDYDPVTLPIVTPDNCVELQNFAAGGWTDIVNRVVVKFSDRVSDYKPGTAIALSQANAVGQDGAIREVTVNYPGCCTQALANDLAARDLAALSRPLMKCRALVNRSFLRLFPGDVVKLNWPEANIANIIMRVVGIGRGTLESGVIPVDLVQDYFYVHRGYPPVPSFRIPSLVTQF
jgi:hypothetical protein